MNSVTIAGRQIGNGGRTFVIAEAGVNHNGSLKTALEVVDAAADAGCDAVKFQTFVAENVVVTTAPKADYQKKNTCKDENQLEMLAKLQLSPDDHGHIAEHCLRKRIVFLSSPFDESCVDVLVALDVPAMKIASGEITNIPFLEYVASQGRPVILSTGMSTLGEVRTAVDVIRSRGAGELVLLHCVSSYPADPGESNLKVMKTMESEFGVPVGFSDHTMGFEVALAAVAMGAAVIEKHFTMDRRQAGPDHQASLLPDELKYMVKTIRTVESAMGDGVKKPANTEKENITVARRSLVARQDIPAGTRITVSHLAAKRPFTGISPAETSGVVGKCATVNIARNQILEWKMIG